MLGGPVQELRSVVRSKMEEEYEEEWVPIPDGEPLRMEVPAPLSLNPVSNVLSVQNLMSGKLAVVSACRCLKTQPCDVLFVEGKRARNLSAVHLLYSGAALKSSAAPQGGTLEHRKLKISVLRLSSLPGGNFGVESVAFSLFPR